MSNKLKDIGRAVENMADPETQGVMERLQGSLMALVTCEHATAQDFLCPQCGAVKYNQGWVRPTLVDTLAAVMREVGEEMLRPDEPAGKA